MAEIKTVEHFAPVGSEADKLLAYPFEAPTHSYLTDGELVTELPDSFDQFQIAADEQLLAKGLLPLGQRIPVVEYGSNVSPYQAQSKMDKFATTDTQSALQTTPKIIAKVPAAAVVWHGKPGQKGSSFAELLHDESTTNSEATCAVAFMSEEQLATMHTTEGVTYHAVWVDVLAGSDEHPMKALAYVAKNSSVALKDGQPIAVQRPGAAPVSGAMTAEQVVDYMTEAAGESVGASSARELIDRAAQTNLAGKKELQVSVADSLAEQEMNRPFSFAAEAGAAVGRADFNSIRADGRPHDELRLMEEVVAGLRPTPEQLAAKAAEFEAKGSSPELALKKARAAIDIAEHLRKRATEEMGIPFAVEKPVARKGNVVHIAD